MHSFDFAPLNGQPLARILQMLEDAGYRPLPIAARGTIAHYAHPAAPEKMLCLSLMTIAAQTHARISAACANNPYLPRIYEHHTLPAPQPLSITVMERLYAASELPDGSAVTLGGIARAAALLPEGEEKHASAHALMLKNKELCSAIDAFTQAVIDSHADETSPHVLRYESGMCGDATPDQQVSYNVLFRKEGANRWRPVFAAPLVSETIEDAGQRHALRLRAAAMAQRCRPPAA